MGDVGGHRWLQTLRQHQLPSRHPAHRLLRRHHRRLSMRGRRRRWRWQHDHHCDCYNRNDANSHDRHSQLVIDYAHQGNYAATVLATRSTRVPRIYSAHQLQPLCWRFERHGHLPRTVRRMPCHECYRTTTHNDQGWYQRWHCGRGNAYLSSACLRCWRVRLA